MLAISLQRTNEQGEGIALCLRSRNLRLAEQCLSAFPKDVSYSESSIVCDGLRMRQWLLEPRTVPPSLGFLGIGFVRTVAVLE
jgi:hypothetical protein